MHPRTLKDMCICAIVFHTKHIQISSKSVQEKYEDVKRLWDELWKLPGYIPVGAADLMNFHLTHPMPKDFSVNLIIALAVNGRMITTLPYKQHLSSLRHLSLLNTCKVFSDDYELYELDLRGVDMESHVDILARLFPRCRNLTILKLGSNVTKEVLIAAKKCPLFVLHMTEKKPWERHLSLLDLMEIFFNISNCYPEMTVRKLLAKQNLDFRAAWVNLSDLSTGYCAVDCYFFVLVLIVFKKLRQFASSIVTVDNCLKEYSQMKMQNPHLDSLSLRKFTYCPHGLSDVTKAILSVVHDIETLCIIMHNYTSGNMYNNLQKLADASLCPKKLRIWHLRHVCQEEPPKNFFSSIGKKVQKLELHGGLIGAVNLLDVCDMLLDFPELEALKLSITSGLVCASASKILSFPKVTSLIINTSMTLKTSYEFLFQMFPSLQEIILETTKVKIENIVDYLKSLTELRIVKTSNLNVDALPGLFELPRKSPYNNQYELYGPMDLLSEQDLMRIQNSGWSFFPKSEDSFRDTFW